MRIIFEIKEGTEVCLEPTGNNAIWHKKPVMGVVSSIGRKYFYVTVPNSPHWGNIKFERETFLSKYDDNAGFNLYPSLNDFLTEKTRKAKLRMIKEALDRSPRFDDPDDGPKPSSDTVSQIYQMLFAENLVPEWEEGMMYGR